MQNDIVDLIMTFIKRDSFTYKHKFASEYNVQYKVAINIKKQKQ